MLEAWLEEDRFQQGVRKYLADHRMGNATTHDLESALPSAATPVMEAFLNTTGVPVDQFPMRILEDGRRTPDIPSRPGLLEDRDSDRLYGDRAAEE